MIDYICMYLSLSLSISISLYGPLLDLAKSAQCIKPGGFNPFEQNRSVVSWESRFETFENQVNGWYNVSGLFQGLIFFKIAI